jgi:2,6-dihydroxypyridine 3-monooxygenase
MPQSFTFWESIYINLRATFPNERYHAGAALLGFEDKRETVSVNISGYDKIDADVLVCADGAQSEMRRRLLQEVQPHYAGYIAWRGTVDEASAPPALVNFFDDTFTFSDARSGGHILAYFIPGAKADPSPGRRQINWVW